MKKIIIMFIVCITVCGCYNDNEKFSEIPLKYAVDSSNTLQSLKRIAELLKTLMIFTQSKKHYPKAIV